MNQQTRFEDVCEVENIKTGQTVTGEILSFREEEFISLTINRAVKLRLNWNERAGLYIGAMAGMEFQSEGPRAYTYRTGR